MDDDMVMRFESRYASPARESLEEGEVVPMPSTPLFKNVSRSLLFESASTNERVAPRPSPVKENLADGDVVPIPTNPDCMTLKSCP